MMPPLLIAAAVLFWGWETDLWFLAIPMAAVLEGARLVQARWEFTAADFTRIWNLCSLLLVAATVIGFFALDGPSLVPDLFDSSLARRSEALTKSSRAVFFMFKWMPIVFFPIMAAQAYSTSNRVPLTVLSWLIRRQYVQQPNTIAAPIRVNLYYVYFTLCLIAASTGSVGQRLEGGFYWALAFLLVWALWGNRSKRYSVLLWWPMILLAVGSGYAGQKGILELQNLINRLDSMLFSQFGRAAVDAKESRTRIGTVGNLKQSGKIVLRLEILEGAAPSLLREASYDIYRSSFWRVSSNEFNTVLPENDLTSWNLLPNAAPKRSLRISQFLHNGQDVLAVPSGVTVFKQLPVFLLETNHFGALRAMGPGLVSYQAHYDEGATIDTAPTADDLIVPELEEDAIAQIAEKLRFHEIKDRNEIMNKISAFFENEYHYSTYTKEKEGTNLTDLANFLLQSRSGHCEYFATATVLLLRKAGIPARYAVGYSVHEGRHKKYVVRQRDGHAWCLVHYNGRWQDFDTTPPSWQALESQRASLWQPISDFFSWLWFEFSKWRWGQTGIRKYVFWILIPLLVIVFLRLVIQKQWVRSRRKADATLPGWPGMDSEFFMVLEHLEKAGLNRKTGEPVLSFLKRIEPSLPGMLESPLPFARDHYRLRFDPAGLSATERAALRNQVIGWVAQAKDALRTNTNTTG